MDKEQLKKVWADYAKLNSGSKIILNPDEKHVSLVADGVLANEKKYGLKLCPCRLRDGKFETDLTLICPCNFEAQNTWKEKGMCWCGLFMKKENTGKKVA